MGITAGSREVPGRNACDRRHTCCIIIIIIIIAHTMSKVQGADEGMIKFLIEFIARNIGDKLT